MARYENPAPVVRCLGFRNGDGKDQFFQGPLGSNGLRLQEKTHRENRREIQSPAPLRCIRIAENHAAGWEDRDQKSSTRWIPVKRAPDASMLLNRSNVPAKPTVVEIRYHPPPRHLGFIVSAVSLSFLRLR